MKSSRQLTVSILLSSLSLGVCLGIVGGDVFWGEHTAFAQTGAGSSCQVCVLNQFECATSSNNAACELNPKTCGGCGGGSCGGGEECDVFGSGGSTYCECV
jgi:hypothetical protein